MCFYTHTHTHTRARESGSNATDQRIYWKKNWKIFFILTRRRGSTKYCFVSLKKAWGIIYQIPQLFITHMIPGRCYVYYKRSDACIIIILLIYIPLHIIYLVYQLFCFTMWQKWAVAILWHTESLFGCKNFPILIFPSLKYCPILGPHKIWG